MACEHNRHEFFDRTAEALQKLPKKAQPVLRVGETTLPLSGASLQRIYQSAMNGTRVGALSEEKRADVRRKTVEVMRWFDLAGIARPTHARRADPTDGRLPRQRTWPGYAAIHDLLNKPARRAALLQHLAAGRAASATASEPGPGAWKCEQCGEFGNAETHLCKRGGGLPDGWDQPFAAFAASHPAQGRPLDSIHYAGYQAGEVRSLPISMVPELAEVSRSLGERFNRISGYTLVLRGPAGDAFTREEEADLRQQVEALGLTLTVAADRRTLEIAAQDEPVFRARHREAVAQALAEGESVAPAILADYPEVVAKQRAREKAARAVRAIQAVAARYGGILQANAQGKVKVSTLTEAAQTRSQQARVEAATAAREQIDIRPGKGRNWDLVNTATNQVMLSDPKKDVLLRWNERRAEQAGQRAFQSRAATERSSLSAAFQALMDPTEPIGSGQDEVLNEAEADPHYGEMVRELRTAREVLTLTAGILKSVGVPARSAARSAFAQQLVRHIPRCARCGRFLPTQDPQCSNPRCDLVGARQGAPVPWPPVGMNFKSSRVKPARSSILYDEGESHERSTSTDTTDPANGSRPDRSGAQDTEVLAGVSPDNGAGTRSRGRTPGTGEPLRAPGGGGDHALPGAEPAAVADHGTDHPDLAFSPGEPAAQARPRRRVSSGTASAPPEETRSLDEEIDRLFGEREQGAETDGRTPALATEVDTKAAAAVPPPVLSEVPAGVQAALQALVEQNPVLLALANGQATGARAEQKALVRAAAALDGGEGLPPYLLTGLQTYEEAQVQAAFGDGAASEGLVSFAQAICLAAGTQRCPDCGQFMGEAAHECPAEALEQDGNGSAPASENTPADHDPLTRAPSLATDAPEEADPLPAIPSPSGMSLTAEAEDELADGSNTLEEAPPPSALPEAETPPAPSPLQAAFVQLVENFPTLIDLANGRGALYQMDMEGISHTIRVFGNDGKDPVYPMLQAAYESYMDSFGQAILQVAEGDDMDEEALELELEAFLLARARPLAEAVCEVAGIRRCDVCGQFVGEGPHECPGSTPATAPPTSAATGSSATEQAGAEAPFPPDSSFSEAGEVPPSAFMRAATPAPTLAQLQEALTQLVGRVPMLLALANGHEAFDPEGMTELGRTLGGFWHPREDPVPTALRDAYNAYTHAFSQARFYGEVPLAEARTLARIVCGVAGMERCATCGQFLGETAHECPVGSSADDAAVASGLPGTPPGETGGVAPESHPSPLSSTAEEGERESSLILEDTAPPMPSGTDYRIDTGQFRPPRFPEEWTETNLQMQRNLAALALLGRLQGQERAATETEQKSLAQWRPWTTMSLNYVQWKDRQAAWWQARNPHEHRLVRRPEVPAPIAAQLWAALAHMGFTGGTVLDTHGGVGELFSTMPEALRATTRRVMLVPDDQEAAIAVQLQQTATVKQTSLAEAEYPHDTFDVVLAVPPAGPVADPSFGGRQFLTKKAADYYAARGLDLTKPGGIVVVLGQVTRESAEVRAALEAQADLVGQARLKLPDLGEQEVLFLRKRFPDQDPSPEALRLTDSPGAALDFQPLQAQASLAALEAQFAALPSDGFRVGAGRCGRCGAWVGPDGDCRNPRCGQTRSRTRRTRQLPADAPERLAHASVLAAATHALLAARTDGAGLSEVEAAQAVLTAAYDDFEARYGALSSTANRAVLRDHQEVALLLSLEELDATTGAVRPTALVRPTTLPDATFVAAPLSLEDALKTTLNEGGTLNPWRLAALTGTSPHEVETALVGQGLAFRVPGGGLQVADEYLSGNVRQKLREARMAAELDPAFAGNVRALQSVVPPDLTPAEIRVNLGATWIDVADIEAFIQHLLPVGGDKITVRYLAATGEWKVDTSRYRDSKRADNTTKWGAGGRTAVQLLRNALNGQRPTSTAPDPTDPTGQRRIVDEEATFAARAKQEEIKEEFIRWLWSDVARARRLTGRYNDLFNAVLPRQYDGSHLTLPGLAPDAEPFYPHQKDAIYRALQGKNTLLGLATGAGKSRTAQATSQEWKRLGQVQTPLHVLLDNTIDDYAAAFQALYPETKLLVVRTKDINSRAKRAALMAKFAGGEYDALLMSQEAFKAIPVEAADMEEITREEVARFDDTIALLEKEGTKQSSEEAQRLRRERNKLASLYKKRLTIAGEDEPLTWGRLQALGVGGMIVDESHFYKEGPIVSKNSRARKQGSARAVDLFVKMRLLNARNGGGHVMWMSGTPVTNNVLSESYWNTLCVRPDLLEERGLTSYDSFVATFAQMAEVPVPTIDGQGFNLVEKPVKIVNVPDLMRIQHEMGTFKLDARELGLPLPDLAGGQVEMVECAPSPRMRAALERFAQRVREGTHPFLLSNEMRHLSLMGARHYDPDFDDPASKVNVLVPALVESHEASRERRGTQLVFCDLATPSGRERRAGYSIYDEIKQKLVAQGIPAEEIAFSHDARTDSQMTRLQADVNEGNVRVLIASREQMGTGVNIQERVTDIHHLDLPWNAARFEQSTARGLRQGNQNDEVRVRAYISAPADVFVANKIKEKAELAAAMYRGDATSREIESDSDIAVNYAEMEALATGNPLVLERFQVANEVRRLEAIQAQWVQSQATSRLQQALLQEKHREAGRKLAQNERAAEVWEASLKEMPLVTGRVGVADLGEKALNQTLLEAAEQMQREKSKAGVLEGEFCGLPFKMGYHGGAGAPVIEFNLSSDLAQSQPFRIKMGERDRVYGPAAEIRHAFREATRLTHKWREEQEELAGEMAVFGEEMEKAFPHHAALDAARARLTDINRDLGLSRADALYQADGADDE